MIRAPLEIDGDAFLFPVAVAGRVEPLFFSSGRRSGVNDFRLGHGGRGAEIVRRIKVLRALHDVKMSIEDADAKR